MDASFQNISYGPFASTVINRMAMTKYLIVQTGIFNSSYDNRITSECDRKCHNHRSQTSLQHCEDETLEHRLTKTNAKKKVCISTPVHIVM